MGAVTVGRNAHLKIFPVYMWLSLHFLFVHGGFDNPPFEVDPDGLGGITLENGPPFQIIMSENVGNNLGSFAIAEIRLTVPGHVIMVSGDPCFSIVSSDDGGETHWYFTSSGAFDFEALWDPTFFIILEFETTDSLLFYVTIKDENDNRPRIQSLNPDPIPPIPELKTIDVPIVTITAVDDDVADNDALTFVIKEIGGDTQSFEVNSKGEVFLTKPLDYSQRSMHALNITIDDPREPDHALYVIIVVIVEDIPNTPPHFTRPPIIRSVTEEIEVGTQLITVQAMDGDFGLNWEIEYVIVDDQFDLFMIDQESGVITVKNRIDAEDERLQALDLIYSFTVVAREIYDHTAYPDLPSELTEAAFAVAFAIADVNDQLPKICTEATQDARLCKEEEEYSFEIPEDHVGRVPMENGIIRVTDMDYTANFNQFRAEFAAGTDEIIKNAFALIPTIGLADQEFFLIVNDPAAIDFENPFWHDVDGNPVVKTFTIVFTGTNNQAHQARAIINATITDVNDNSFVTMMSFMSTLLGSNGTF